MSYACRPLFACALAALPAPASAQVTEAEANVLPRIIDMACVDLLDGHPGCETAVLLASETEPDAADLIIFSAAPAPDSQEILAVARAVAFSGAWMGQMPRLEAGADGQLLLHEEQIAIGRTPWTQTLTIANGDTGLVVVGLSYSTYDRPMGGGFSCVVDYLAGDWALDWDRPDPESGETIHDVSDQGQIEGAPPTLATWAWDQGLPAPCACAVNAWFDASEG
ncbi:hypothetical protein [Gymnodinialimonas sp.]